MKFHYITERLEKIKEDLVFGENQVLTKYLVQEIDALLEHIREENEHYDNSEFIENMRRKY